jgi:4-amino-4-deoxy-L-arabinose transferase-like glycosyltransferase
MLSNLFSRSYFDHTQLSLLVVASAFFLISLYFQSRSKANLAVIFLILTAICVFSFAALLDPFLNLWDERFHALVAKNLINHPLMPTLYDNPIVNMDYDRWDRFHIWLHKQPLFLWQIALSFKLFGISEFSLRIPNVVLGAVFVLICYRSGKLLVNQRVGYISGVLVISTIYILELIGGRQELDLNDFSFMVYISLSIWSFIEYYFSNNKIWLFFIGLFSGFAILCKWLVGLLIYFGWFILKIQNKKFKFYENKDLFLSLFITFLVAAPWQILTFLWYPTEAFIAYKFNVLHFSIPLEGHTGNFFYQFDMFNIIYGALASFLILPSFYFMRKNVRDDQLFYSLLGMVIVVYLFFSFTATKMPSFTIIVFMIIVIAFASLVNNLIEFINKNVRKELLKRINFSVLIILLVLLRFDIEYLQEKHTTWKNENTYTQMLTYNREIFKSLRLPINTVLFNVKGRHYIEAMFYTGLPAYNIIPSVVQYKDLKSKGWRIAIFKSPNIELPIYLKDDSKVIIIDKELKGYE